MMAGFATRFDAERKALSVASARAVRSWPDPHLSIAGAQHKP